MVHSRRTLLTGSAAALAGLAGHRRLFAQGTPDASPASGETRIVHHAMGDTEVPVNPQRVVVLDGPPLDACFILGVIPVGATTGIQDAPWPEYLGEGTKDIVNVGDIAEPNLEKILALQPDLIISLKIRHEEIYPQLSQIAPTVFSEDTASGWRDSFLIFADALNRNDQVPGIVGAYEDRCAAIAGKLGDHLPETTVSIVRIVGDTLRNYQLGSFSGSVLEDIGFPRPASQMDPEASWIELSTEQFREVDAAYMFVCFYGDQDTADFSALADSPLWNTLDVVKNNRVYYVPDDYWMVAIGYIAAGLMLDDIEKYIIEGAAPPPIPGVE